MRLSTGLFYETSLQNLQKNTFNLNQTQLQIATGNKILKPSDDPIGHAKSVLLEERKAVVEQHQSNITIAENRLMTSESVMASIVNVLQRARELGIQSDNGSLNSDDQEIIALEIQQLTLELQDLMNTVDGLGGYLFGGFQTQQPPFVERNGGGFDYVGDEGVNLLQVASSTFVTASDSGRDLFVDVDSASNSVVTRASTRNSQDSVGFISSGVIRDQTTFDLAYPEDYVITFNDPELNQDRQTFTVIRSSDNSPVLSQSPGGYLVNMPYTEGTSIQFEGVEVTLSGQPQTGDVFFVESTNNQSILNLLDRFSNTLLTLNSNDQTLPNDVTVIGRATPGKANSNTAGNYVAAQTIRVVNDDGSSQNLSITANESMDSIVTNLNAMNGVSASINPTEATLDFRNTTAFEGEQISFTLNNTVISATVGATDTDTYNRIEASLTDARFTNLSFTNNNDGTFSLTESTGADIEIEDFAVTDFPRLNIDVLGGITAGDTIAFDLVGSNGENFSISYNAAANNSVDELFTAMSTGTPAAFSVTQPAGPGTDILLRYTGDTDGDSFVQITNFTNSNGASSQLAVVPESGTQVINQSTSTIASILSTGTDYEAQSIESRATMQFQGSLGDAVTLLENSNDSSKVAATFSYSLSTGFSIATDVSTANGGLVPDNRSYDEVVRNLFEESVNNFLADIDSAENAVIQSRSEMGSRINQLTEIEDLNFGTIIELEGFISELKDVDYAQASTDLNFQAFVLEATQTTFIRISQLNLFDLLR